MPKTNWEDKLIDLVEKEIELASGVKSKEHFSGDCRMNDILELVRKTRQEAIQEVLGEVDYIIEGIKKWQDTHKTHHHNFYTSMIKSDLENIKAKITNLRV